ncbi:hypothetical protein HNV12_06225 [Methanococcoides sp. SA1]|nr:hypothetical protein [Methanococcoides sp. SA1]
MGRADDMTYIGEYLHIVNSGYFASWDIYPASHIVGAGISIVSNIEPHLVSFIIPIVFSFMFIVGIYLFSRNLFPDTDITSLVVVSSFILYLGTYNFLNVPNALFFAFMPFYLYVLNSYTGYHHKNILSFSIIFILITLMIPYTHPFIVFFVLIIILFHVVFNITRNHKVIELHIPKLNINSFIILCVAFSSWFFYQGRLLNDLYRSINNYINQIGRDPTAFWAAEKMIQVHFGIFDYLHLLMFFYGRYIIPSVFIFISFIYLYYNKTIINNNRFKYYQYTLILYAVFLIIQLIFLFNPVIAHQPDRIMNLNFVVYAQIPLFAIALYIIFLNRTKSIYNILMVCAILASIWTISFFGAFDSQNVYRPSSALTYNEVQGMSWFSDSKGDYPVSMSLDQTNRYPDILGFSRSEWTIKRVPPNFGYGSENNTFNEVYFDSGYDDYNKGYLAITSLSQLIYKEVPKKSPTFIEEDFMKLSNDSSVNKVYDSFNMDIFIIFK